MVAYTYYEFDPRVIREAEAAVDGGFDVDFLALRRANTPSTETIRGVRVMRLNQARYRGRGRLQYLIAYLNFFVRCFVKITGLFFRRHYRVIHVNNMPDFLVFSTIVPRLLGTKVILDIHDPMPNTFVSKFKGRESRFFYHLLLWQERISAAYCNSVITVHDPVKHGILTKHGLAPDSIEVIANFADDGLFPLQQALPIKDKIRFVFHGTILERSGLRILMTAVSQVRHKDRIALKIIGEGDFSQALKNMIQSLNLGKIVEFDNRSHPAHSISRQIADCHVGLAPLEVSSATNYAVPLKLLEYISMGLPVVTVRNYAITYYFSEDDCIFYQWDDANSLSAILDRIAEDPEILTHYRERSLALRDRFSWTSQREKYVTLLRQLMRASKSPSEGRDTTDRT
jgi:glycosyltransferase involved in cell wall biosynthesis